MLQIMKASPIVANSGGVALKLGPGDDNHARGPLFAGGCKMG